MSSTLPTTVSRRFEAGFRRFGFPLSLLVAAITIHSGWIAEITFLGTYIQWAKIQAFLLQNNEGFFITALLAFYLETVRPNSFSDFFRTKLTTLDAFLASVTTADAIRFFLRQHHDSGTRDLEVEQLAEYVLSQKPTLTNATVELTLRRTQGSIHQRCRIHYDASLDYAVIALARTTSIQAHLIALFPEILEIAVLDHQPDFQNACIQFLKDSPIKVDSKALRFEPMRAGSDVRLDRMDNTERGRDWDIFVAPVNEDGRRRKRGFTVDLQFTKPDKLGDFTHWLADRPMHVRRIVVNVAGLDSLGTIDVSLIPFLGAFESIQGDDFAKGECTVTVNRWLVHGQGVCVAWHNK